MPTMPMMPMTPTMHMKKASIIMLAMLAFLLLGAGCTASKDAEQAADVVTGVQAVNAGKTGERDLAIAKARELFQLQYAAGTDFSSGPCLSNNLIADWVADIAHTPRTDEDAVPANQCSAYREGTAHHFVELDSGGNLIRAE